MKKKSRLYCWVPGCFNKPVTDRHPGAGRCPEHRYAPQPSTGRLEAWLLRHNETSTARTGVATDGTRPRPSLDNPVTARKGELSTSSKGDSSAGRRVVTRPSAHPDRMYEGIMNENTSISKHTPGPWELEAYTDGVYHIHGRRDQFDWLVARLEAPKGDPVTRANARLIAAAPDLLEALEKLDQFQRYFAEHAYAEGRMPGNDFYSDLGMEVVKLGRRAIAKARGEAVPS